MDQKNEMFMQQTTCSRWGIFEVGIDGPKDGNPFIEQKVTGIFKGDNETVSCDGFYDGEVCIASVLCHLLRVCTPTRFRPHLEVIVLVVLP